MMKEIRRRSFEYYSDKAEYDNYTHDNDYDEDPHSEEYYALPDKVFEHVFAKAQCDWEMKESMSSMGQIGEYLLKEGIISKKDLDMVIDELFIDYKLHFNTTKDGALRKRRSRYI